MLSRWAPDVRLLARTERYSTWSAASAECAAVSGQVVQVPRI